MAIELDAMQTVKLNNGLEIPSIGLGTYPMNGRQLVSAVRMAVELGYKRIDTASAYENEYGLGRALKRVGVGASAPNLFLTTKLSNEAQRQGDVRAALLGSLRRLGVDRVDLYLLHWPQPDTFLESWRQMEEIYREGLVGAIGVCNFHFHHLDRLLAEATVIPAVNQVELHPLLPQISLREYCQNKGIVVEAYSPLARMHSKLIHHPVLVEVAKKHGKTVPQVVLRWDIQQGILMVPKSSRRAGLLENISLFDFVLDPEEMNRIGQLNEEFRVRFNPDAYPFRKSQGKAVSQNTAEERDHPQKSLLLFGHGGSQNRGCEAIVRGTASVLRLACGSHVSIRLSSQAPQEDRSAGLLDVLNAIMDSGSQWPVRSPVRWVRSVLWRLLRSPEHRYILSNLRTLRWAARADVCLSVGGDNYCYDPVEIYFALNRLLRKRCRKMVLWGCSIEPSRMDEAMLVDLRQFDLITARESITFDALRERGIEQVKLFQDPAFAMEEERLSLPNGWREGGMVGLNLSPLIERYEKHPGTTLAACAELVRHILLDTKYGVVLIPHVTGTNSDDRFPLGCLYDEFRSEGRVLMLPGGLNAPQTKGYISRCRFFVGARTHATIAAYSTGVPTLVLGYSVKARGIARDLFGDEKGLLLPVQELSNATLLIQAFDGVREREVELRALLQKTMPAVIRAAQEAGAEIDRLIST